MDPMDSVLRLRHSTLSSASTRSLSPASTTAHCTYLKTIADTSIAGIGLLITAIFTSYGSTTDRKKTYFVPFESTF
jgi:hypothetical protein